MKLRKSVSKDIVTGCSYIRIALCFSNKIRDIKIKCPVHTSVLSFNCQLSPSFEKMVEKESSGTFIFVIEQPSTEVSYNGLGKKISATEMNGELVTVKEQPLKCNAVYVDSECVMKIQRKNQAECVARTQEVNFDETCCCGPFCCLGSLT